MLSAAQHDTIISQLPVSAENGARALPAVPVAGFTQMNLSQPTPAASPAPEKKATNIGYYADNAAVNAPPPAYPSVPAAPAGPMPLAYAAALYQYNAQDAGDLALMPNDKVTVTEYMNNEWWKGRNERTGMEGIFPASYVRKDEKAVVMAPSAPLPAPSNYSTSAIAPARPASPPRRSSRARSLARSSAMRPSSVQVRLLAARLSMASFRLTITGATIGGNIVNSIF
jgi:hypothetical protein